MSTRSWVAPSAFDMAAVVRFLLVSTAPFGLPESQNTTPTAYEPGHTGRAARIANCYCSVPIELLFAYDALDWPGVTPNTIFPAPRLQLEHVKQLHIDRRRPLLQHVLLLLGHGVHTDHSAQRGALRGDFEQRRDVVGRREDDRQRAVVCAGDESMPYSLCRKSTHMYCATSGPSVSYRLTETSPYA